MFGTGITTSKAEEGYQLNHHGKDMGEAVIMGDGTYHYWVSRARFSFFDAKVLRNIADTLDILNGVALKKDAG